MIMIMIMIIIIIIIVGMTMWPRWCTGSCVKNTVKE